MDMASHAQGTRDKFAKSLQNLREEVSDEVDFLHPDKHSRFLQVDTVFFYWFVQVCQKYSDMFAIFLLYLKKEIRNEVDILHACTHQSCP